MIACSLALPVLGPKWESLTAYAEIQSSYAFGNLSSVASGPDQQLPGEQANRSSAEQGKPDASTKIIYAERVMFRLVGYPEMSGEYRVSSDGTLSLPIVGRISVARLDIAGLEQFIADKINAMTGRPSYPTIEITKYSPIYVTGFVSVSGASEWQPNLSVLQAVTISGGLFRASDSPDALAK